MTYQQLQDKIVSSFWSGGLKAEIARRNFVFPPMDLMAAAYHHTRTYTDRLALLQLFADHVPEVSEDAQRIIDWERWKLEQIKTPADGTIYELRISDENPTEWDDYLCTDFDACLSVIDEHYKRYDWQKETPQTCYSIVRRKLLVPGDDLTSENLGCCDLLPGKIIEAVWFGNSGEFEDCTGHCWECEHECINNQEAVYPAFLPDKSPVRYRLPDGTVHFGITLGDMTDTCLAYVIPLDSEMLVNRDYEQFFDHEHIPFPDVDLASRDDIPDDLWENYETFVDYLNRTK